MNATGHTVAARLRRLDRLGETYLDLGIADTVRILLTILARIFASRPRRHSPGPAKASQAPMTLIPLSALAPDPWPAPHSVEPMTTPDEPGAVPLGLIEEIEAIEMERVIGGLVSQAAERQTTADLLGSRATVSQD